MDQSKIAYEPHPVSPERKKFLRSQGYKIVDAAFAPAGYAEQGGEKIQQGDERTLLIAELTERGIAFDDSMGNDELRSLTIAPEPVELNPTIQPTDDGLAHLDAEQLHALAQERGVKVHHKAGADKVREALRKVAQ